MKICATGCKTDVDNFEMQIVAPHYVKAIWCKQCEKIAIGKDYCPICNSKDVYLTLQKEDPIGFDLSHDRDAKEGWNKTGAAVQKKH
jgi:hypothetical protein